MTLQVGLGDQEQVVGDVHASSLRSSLALIVFGVRSRRRARILIWRSDSSPETYSTRGVARHLQGHLQQQGGLADARVAADQHDRAGHHPAAQHAGKLANGDRQALFDIAADLGQAARRRARRPARALACAAAAGGVSATTSSTMLFQAPHCGQRPIWRALTRPHCWQTYWVCVFGMR